MLNEMTQDELLPRLQAMLYGMAAVAVCWLLYEQYLQGLYSVVLTNAIALPTFLFGAITVYVNRASSVYRLINYPVVALIALLALYQLPHYPVQMTHYLYALPLFCFFCLPLLAATILNLILLVALCSILWMEMGMSAALRASTNYLLLAGSAWCIAYLTLLKHWSIRQLSLIDAPSGAYSARHFDYVLEREIVRDSELSAIAIVIDDYQQLFDIYGARVMAAFLPNFVSHTRRLVRAGDEIFRLSDDCFVLLLPDCPEEGSVVLMERIKRSLEGYAWKPFVDVSFRAAATSLQEHDSREQMLKRLMNRLHKRKQTALQIAAFAQQ